MRSLTSCLNLISPTFLMSWVHVKQMSGRLTLCGSASPSRALESRVICASLWPGPLFQRVGLNTRYKSVGQTAAGEPVSPQMEERRSSYQHSLWRRHRSICNHANVAVHKLGVDFRLLNTNPALTSEIHLVSIANGPTRA